MRKGSKKRRKEEVLLPESDETFAFIAGYTSGGVPFGITWEEWDQIERTEKKEETVSVDILLDDELPFK